MSSARMLLVAVLILVSGGAELQAQRRRGGVADEVPQARPSLGLQLKEEGGRLVVVDVIPGSPAEAAGILPGDVILNVAGGAVTNVIMLQRWVAVASARGVKLDLGLERAGRALTIQVGAAPGAQGAISRPRFPTGAATPIPTRAQAPMAGQGFNVLRYAALDPRSGEVVCWGDYDPAYPTGAIPYEALLAEALRNPSPSFSLEPTPAGRSAGQTLDRRIASDAERMSRDAAYAQNFSLRLLQVLGKDLAQRPDGQRFATRCGKAFGLTPAEAMDVLQPEQGKQARGMNGYMTLIAKAVRHFNAPVAADALLTMIAGDIWGALDQLGVGTEGRSVRDAFQAGTMPKEQAFAKLEALVWKGFLAKTSLTSSAADAELARRGPAAFTPWAQERFTTWVSDKVYTQMMHGLVLGEEAIHRLYPGLPALELQPVCLDGLDPKSSLGQVFMRADVAMKSILALSDLADRVPGHRSQAEYHQAFLAQRGKGGTGGGLRARTWLQPGMVELRVDPQGALVRFGEAQMGIRSQMLVDTGGFGGLQQEGLNAYATEVSARYEAYARVEPELHRLREAAKVLALARWARARGLTLRSASGTGEGALGMVPKGFVQATFLMEGERLFLQPAAVGGVDFSSQRGEGWVKAQPEAGIVPSALGQLQASAALAGQAADRALAGDLTGARELAQRSADAMTGKLQGGALPDLPVPTAVEVLPMAQASTGLLGRVQNTTARLQQAGPGTPEAEAARVELQGLREQSQRLVATPQAAPQVVALLRTPGPLPKASPPVVEPTPAPPAAVEKAFSPEDRRRLLDEATALRNELCRIRGQFQKLNANIQADQAQRTTWEGEIEGAYGRAWDRLTKDIMVDAFAGVLLDRWNKVVGKGLRSAEERAKLAKAAQVLKTMQLARNYQDFADWASLESVDSEYVREGLTQVFDQVEGEEVTRQMLMRWLKRPIPKGTMDYYGAAKNVVDTAFDLTAEGFAWARLRQMDRNSEDFLKAVKALAHRQTQVLEGIHAREKALGLPPGTTRDGCN